MEVNFAERARRGIEFLVQRFNRVRINRLSFRDRIGERQNRPRGLFIGLAMTGNHIEIFVNVDFACRGTYRARDDGGLSNRGERGLPDAVLCINFAERQRVQRRRWIGHGIRSAAAQPYRFESLRP